MSELGKIFIYEKNLDQLNQLIENLKLRGFYTFGTDNLYALVQYAKEVHPDIVVINLPSNHTLSEEDICKLEKNICQTECPDIYINQNINSEHISKFHNWNFSAESITDEQLLEIITSIKNKSYLH